MIYKIKVSDKTVHKTSDWNEALRVVKEIFKRGHDDIYLIGGKIGYWR